MNGKFGSTVFLTDSWVLIGAPYMIKSGQAGSGAAYLFNAATGEHIASFYPSPDYPIESFGSSIAVSDYHVAIGTAVGSAEAIFIAEIPEPPAILMVLAGLAATCWCRRRLRRLVVVEWVSCEAKTHQLCDAPLDGLPLRGQPIQLPKRIYNQDRSNCCQRHSN
jgi:hypothetical protein